MWGPLRTSPKGELLLAPCCPTARVLPKTTTNPRAMALEVGEVRPVEATHRATYWALPDLRLPQVVKRGARAADPRGSAEETSAAPGDAGATAAAEAAGAPADDAGAAQAAQDSENPYMLQWEGSEALHFFWAVDTLTAEEMAREQIKKGQEHWEFNLRLHTQEYQTMIN